MSDERSHPALQVFMGLGLALTLMMLPLPGVDQGASLAQMGRLTAYRDQLGFNWPPAYSLLTPGIAGLVLARATRDLLTAPEQSPTTQLLWSSVVWMGFVGGVMLYSSVFALRFAERLPDLVLVRQPGQFMVFALTSTAVAAMATWHIASYIRASGWVNGAPLLLLVVAGTREVWRFIEYYMAFLEPGGAEPGLAWVPLHSPLLPAGLVALALWRHLPAPDARKAGRNLKMLGGLSLIAIPFFVSSLASGIGAEFSGLPSWMPQPPIYDQGMELGSLLGILTIPPIAWWLQSKPGRPGGLAWGIFGMISIAFVIVSLVLGLTYSN